MFTQECIKRQPLQPLPFQQARRPGVCSLAGISRDWPHWHPAFSASLPPSLNPPAAPCVPGSHSLVHGVCPVFSTPGSQLLGRTLAAGKSPCQGMQIHPGNPSSAPGAGWGPAHSPLAYWASPACLFQGIPRGVTSPRPSQGPAVTLGAEFNWSSPTVSRRDLPAVPEIRAAECLNTAAREGQNQRPGALPSPCPRVWRDTARLPWVSVPLWGFLEVENPGKNLPWHWLDFGLGLDPPHTDTDTLGRRGCVLFWFPCTQRQIPGLIPPGGPAPTRHSGKAP